LNISNQVKIGGNYGNSKDKGNQRSLNSLSVLLDADQMVRKLNNNNINKIFSGDDAEPQDSMRSQQTESEHRNEGN